MRPDWSSDIPVAIVDKRFELEKSDETLVRFFSLIELAVVDSL